MRGRIARAELPRSERSWDLDTELSRSALDRVLHRHTRLCAHEWRLKSARGCNKLVRFNAST